MSLLQLNPVRAPLIPINWYRWLRFCPPRTETFKEIHVYISLTFGIGPKGTSGATNEHSAQMLGWLWQTVAKPIIAQKEVYDALHAQGQVSMDAVHRIFGPNENRSTHVHRHSSDSVQDALTICRQNGWERIALVGHSRHIPRVTRCFQKQGLEVVHVETAGIGYCPDSTQKWCRGPIVFTMWELGLAIPLYTLMGKI